LCAPLQQKLEIQFVNDLGDEYFAILVDKSRDASTKE